MNTSSPKNSFLLTKGDTSLSGLRDLTVPARSVKKLLIESFIKESISLFFSVDDEIGEIGMEFKGSNRLPDRVPTYPRDSELSKASESIKASFCLSGTSGYINCLFPVIYNNASLAKTLKIVSRIQISQFKLL